MDYIPAKSIISGYRENNNWFGFNYNMNIYKGCSHGCIYCDSRSECYGIDNFDIVRIKENALDTIRKELKSKRKKGVVATGAMSDPYNPFENKFLLTRNALEIINGNGFGVAIATKSDLITRDIDILQSIKKHSPILCKITITTADDELCKRIEPNVVVTSKRFEAIRKLSNAGIYTGILLMPILPFINDTEENIINIVRMAKENGAKFIYPAFGVTLRANQRNYFFDRLDESFPNIKEKYIKNFGNEYMCASLKAKKLYKIFVNECNKLGLLYKMSDIIYSYKKEYNNEQLSLF
ncbi:radical SAM protein [Clostridium sp. CTA-7]